MRTSPLQAKRVFDFGNGKTKFTILFLRNRIDEIDFDLIVLTDRAFKLGDNFALGVFVVVTVADNLEHDIVEVLLNHLQLGDAREFGQRAFHQRYACDYAAVLTHQEIGDPAGYAIEQWKCSAAGA